MIQRRLPPRFRLGQSASGSFNHIMFKYREWKESGSTPDPLGRRIIAGFVIPEWQRPLVWSKEQQVRLIDSFIGGIPIGSYSYTSLISDDDDMLLHDNLLIDGQQRINALQSWMNGEFCSSDGIYWGDLTPADVREISMRPFQSYEVEGIRNIAILKDYYNRMNFGGTAHDETHKAVL